MKAGLTLVMGILAAMSALPASAQKMSGKQAAQPIALSAEEIPATDRFAGLLTRYRNCVLAEVEAAPLGIQETMAREAMAACAISRGELRSQLFSDIREKRPKVGNAVALVSADYGVAQVDPMIEQAAIDWAHRRYARNMY
ncbi:MAG: hypothetical protein J7498_02610 [Sphingobium sp.]|nr:hypothetical protein [Sphingobium sp.]